jgi:hypothetical protein
MLRSRVDRSRRGVDVRLAAWACACALTTVGVDAVQPRRPVVFDRIETATDVGWLESVASSYNAALRELGRSGYSPKHVRQRAYVRLGALRSRASLAAVRRIEDHVGQSRLTDAAVTYDGRQPHPGWHMSDPSFTTPAIALGADGRRHAVVTTDMLGGRHFYLMSDHPRRPVWTRPHLIPGTAPDPFRIPQILEWEGPDELRVTYEIWKGQKERDTGSHRFSLAAVVRDGDADGWTDVEERHMGLNPERADSDADGLNDDRDRAPLHAPRPGESADEEVRILQRAIFAAFGIYESRWALLVDPASRAFQFANLGGPVLFNRSSKDEGLNGGVYVSWRIVRRTADEALVEVSDVEGNLAGGGQEILVRRILGEWVVVAHKTTWIS